MESDASARRPKGAVVFFLVVLAAAIASFGYLLWDFVTDLVLGFLIAGACRPYYQRLVTAFKGRATLAAAVTTIAVTVLVAVPTVLFVTSLSRQAATAYSAVSESLSGAAVQDALHGEGWVGKQAARIADLAGVEYSPASLRDTAAKGAGTIAAFLTVQLNSVIANVLSAIYHFMLMLVVVFFGLIDGPTIKRRVFELSPLPDEEEELIVRKFKDVGGAIFIGNGMSSALQGLFGGLALWATGLPSPLFWGVVMSIFAFLPLIGVAAVAVPAALYLAIIGRMPTAIMFFAFCMLQSMFIENVIKPKMMGDRMEMHSMLIFFALLGGISAFGITGLLYGPLVATFFLTVVDLYHRAYRERVLST
jgi:predicted PurR-regulated permease PerM